MRSREEIIKEAERRSAGEPRPWENIHQWVIALTLLDIRELLQNPTIDIETDPPIDNQ